MAKISREDYFHLLLPGFTIPPAWFPNGVAVPHHHNEPTILLEPASKSGPIRLSPNSQKILAISQTPPSWPFLHAAESGITAAVEALNNRPHDAVQSVHSGRTISLRIMPKVMDWDAELENLLRAARTRAEPDHSIHSPVYNAGGGLDSLSPFGRHIVCGAAVMTLALRERIEILGHSKGDINFDLQKFSRVSFWEIDEEDQRDSVARFKGTTRFYKGRGLNKVNFDTKLMDHIEVKGCYENPTVLMGGWMTRLLIPGNQQFRNLLCAAELTFYIDHNLDYHGIINMHEIFCKLAGCIELGVGVRQAGLAFGTAIHNDMKRRQEEATGKNLSANIRMNHLSQFEFISAMICDIGVFEVLAYEDFGKDEINDGALCGFLQDFTDVGEDSACGELGFSLGSWGPKLDTNTVLKWIMDLARLQNHGLIHRPERPIVIANYLITLWNCLDDRHHTLPRSLSYLRHTKLGFIDGYTQIYDLFDDKMNYIGNYTGTGALEEMDGENVLKECSHGWDKKQDLENYGTISVQIVNTINKMRDCERVLEAGLLIVRWFIYVPRMIREDIQNIQFAQDMAKLCLQVEDEMRSAVLVISCWMKFDDREFGFFRCRESLAEAAALYSLDQSQHDKFYNLEFLGDVETKF